MYGIYWFLSFVKLFDTFDISYSHINKIKYIDFTHRIDFYLKET